MRKGVTHLEMPTENPASSGHASTERHSEGGLFRPGGCPEQSEANSSWPRVLRKFHALRGPFLASIFVAR